MTRKLFVIALLFVMIASVPASGVMVFGTLEPEPAPNSPRVIPSDPKLPPYDNPAEIDLDGPLHISFKGAFRRVKNNKPNNYVAFCFVAVPQQDMILEVNQSEELFDGKARRFHRGNWTPDIGVEETRRREIIAGIPIQIRFGFDMPVNAAGELPSIARVSFQFNGKWFQFRNIKTEEWSVWEGIYQELAL